MILFNYINGWTYALWQYIQLFCLDTFRIGLYPGIASISNASVNKIAKAFGVHTSIQIQGIDASSILIRSSRFFFPTPPPESKNSILIS